jgi:hypothetical protein
MYATLHDPITFAVICGECRQQPQPALTQGPFDTSSHDGE